MSNPRNRIFAAILVGIIMIGGAIFYGQKAGEENAQQQKVAAAGLAPTDRKHIPITDSDKNGIPDWQEQIIDAEPIFIDASSTLELQPPKNFTEQFADDMFQDMLTLDELGLLSEGREQLINAGISSLIERTEETGYTEADLNSVSAHDPEALRAYGNLVAGHIYYGVGQGSSEYTLFEEMVRTGNPRYLEELKSIERDYEAVISTLLELEVPEQYTFEHLVIVNSLAAMKSDVAAMQLHFDDPLLAFVHSNRYPVDLLGMRNGLFDLYDRLYLSDHVLFQENDSLPAVVTLLSAL